MTSASLPSLLLIGCGKMGAALATGWLRADVIRDRLWIADPSPIPAHLSADARVAPWPGAGLKTTPNATPNADTAGKGTRDTPRPAAIVLAIKPQQFAAVLPTYRAQLAQRPVIVSIAAGVTLARIGELLAYDGPIVRTMPNTPAAIGQGITALVANAATRPEERAQAESLLAASGATVWLSDEDQMHAVTALSGSGPAYVFAFIEALAAAGESLGLDPDMAARLARATVTGSAALAAASPDSPAVLRQNVTSPGGTTAAALAVLQAGLPDLVAQTAHAAAERSLELARG